MQYDVFISFKNSGKNGQQTPDAGAARKLHAALKQRGISTFFSEESLAEKGSGHFSKTIEGALDSARVLVLVASCREHIESRWVEAEWDSFLQDVRSGHKEGELFILNCGDLKPAELPLFLRRQQMFKDNDLDKMLSFIGSAMSPPTTLNDLIALTLHCHRPEKNEDKVYLMTVQQGSSAATRNVVAHWGARASKRLNSQVKAINVSVDDSAKEVEKARQEKLRGGYAPASHVNLLTPDAWSFLAASLNVADAPPREKSAKTETGKKAPKTQAKVVSKAPAKAPAKTLPKASPKTPSKATVRSSKTASTAPAAAKVSKPTAAKKPLAKAIGGTICISGKLPSGKRKADYAQPLQAIGFQLVDDVVKGLSYLVVADTEVATGKSEKARKLGIPILSEAKLKSLMTRASKTTQQK